MSTYCLLKTMLTPLGGFGEVNISGLGGIINLNPEKQPNFSHTGMLGLFEVVERVLKFIFI